MCYRVVADRNNSKIYYLQTRLVRCAPLFDHSVFVKRNRWGYICSINLDLLTFSWSLVFGGWLTNRWGLTRGLLEGNPNRSLTLSRAGDGIELLVVTAVFGTTELSEEIVDCVVKVILLGIVLSFV